MVVPISQTALGEKGLGMKSDHAYRQFNPNCQLTAHILNVTDKYDKIVYMPLLGSYAKIGRVVRLTEDKRYL